MKLEDTGFVILRGAAGGLLAAHGAQKLFGWFGGHGLHGTAGWLESQGLRPGRPWALAAGLSEFGGGLLTVLGLLNPLGPLGLLGAMGMATAKFHKHWPVWAGEGGAELPLTNVSIAAALALAGPGRYSLDHLMGIRLPRWLVIPGLATVAGVIAFALQVSRQPQAAPQAEQAAPAAEARETLAQPEQPVVVPIEAALDQPAAGA